MILELMQAELKRDEGIRYTPYADNSEAKNMTVGVGHNLAAASIPSAWKYPLSEAQVMQLLAHDIAITTAALDLHLPWWSSLDEVRQRAFANMCFNLGIQSLLGFHNSLNEIARGDYAMAALSLAKSAWYSQVGIRAVRICNAIKTGIMEE